MHPRDLGPFLQQVPPIQNDSRRMEDQPDNPVIQERGCQPAENYRPINLNSVIYKLFAGILANRLTAWTVANKSISPTQKGFMPRNGVHEHGFVATTLMNRARRCRGSLYQVWYDLENAFPSVSFSHMSECLRRSGVPESFTSLMDNIYTDSFTAVRLPDGMTPAIPNKRGLKQGCPLSPILFNFCLEPLLRSLHHIRHSASISMGGEEVNNLAFADDLKGFASTMMGIKLINSEVEKFLSWTLMKANTDKCAYLSIYKGKEDRPSPDIKLQGATIPRIGVKDAYKYLGLADSFTHTKRAAHFYEALHSARKDCSKLFASGLLPWQKMKAVKVYIYPQLEFLMRNTKVPHVI